MVHLINLLSIIPVRKEPSHRSEMVSQLLFGETAFMIEEGEDFVRVKGLYDGYEGWCQRSQLTAIGATDIKGSTEFTSTRFAEVLMQDVAIFVPFGTPVYNAEQRSLTVGDTEIKYLMPPRQLWDTTKHSFTPENIRTVYQLFIHTPYLWGGKSVLGIDCSGFVQQVFKMFGILLLRDAYLQAGQGRPVSSFQDAEYGDLVFFRNGAGKIVHTGLLIENNRIVHAAGRVKIDRVDGKGIINSDTGKLTHELHSIRRYI